jgi:predicted GNAT family acetyltransferase
MEVLTDRATKAFAEKAQSHAGTHLILCEENRIEKFWSFYATPGQQMRRASRQLLFELRWPIEVSKHDSNLRLATSQDLNLLIPVHAEMALDQSGTDPRSVDPKGFEDRYSRRISRGRTWVVVENGVLIFKAEVVSQTPETAYIEGVWVNPSVRRQGRGRSCLAQLSKMLLWRTKSLCMTVNDEHEVAQAFVKKSGYHLRSVYDSIFLT